MADLTQEQEFEFRLRMEQEAEAEAAAAAPKKMTDPNQYLYKPVAGGAGVLGAELLGPGISQGVENIRKGRAEDMARANQIAKSNLAQQTAAAKGVQFNPTGVSPQMSAANWEAYNDLQQQAANRANRTTAMQKKFPNYQRPGAGQVLSGNAPVQPVPSAPVSTQGSQLSKDTSRFLKGLGGRSYLPFVGRGLAGLSTGVQGADAYNRFKDDDYTGGVISGLGALGSAATLVPIPVVRGIGTAASVAAPMINDYRDKLRRGEIRHEDFTGENIDPMGSGFAVGGLVPGYNKGKSVLEGLIDLSKKFKYDAAKVAKDYPTVIPPVTAIDKTTGKEFLQKQLSSEAKAVQNARKFAQKEIDTGNYTPFFNITERTHVDPSNYPLPIKTIDVTLPKKAETVAAHTLKAEHPEAIGRLNAAYDAAKEHPGAHDFYAMGQLEDAFVKELGPEAGRAAFKSRFADPLAATTGGADPNSNLMTAAYTNFVRQKGQDLPANTYELPFPVGGRFIAGNIDQARKYHDVGELSPTSNPKRYNFSSNFQGHLDRPTVDEQMMRLFDPKGKMAPDWYGINEGTINKLAEERGVSPVNFQEVAWAGGKGYEGKPMIQEINEMIHRTSRITGQTPEEVLKGFIHSDKPMYGIGAGALGAAASEDGKFAKGGSTTPAWQRAEGKNPEGGLNAVGRASYNRETGGHLKAPQPEGGPRKKSFCARMEGMKKKNTSAKTANDPDSRINKSLRKWKC